MKLTKTQWETILRANGAADFEVIESSYYSGEYQIKFMPGTDFECVSEHLSLEGYFSANRAELRDAPAFVREEMERIVAVINNLTGAVSKKARALGMTENYGELFIVGNVLHYLADNGVYEKTFVLYEGKQTTVTKLEDVLAQLTFKPNHPQYNPNPTEDFELYRQALGVTYEVNLIDNTFLNQFENSLSIAYLEILLGEKLNYAPTVEWETVKQDVKLSEVFGEDKVKTLIEIVEVIKYLSAE